MSEQGGYRQGTPGKAYTNRSDLAADRQPVRVARGKDYGERQAAEQSQTAMPLPDVSNIPAPGSVPSLTAPTTRPGEPVTAGIPIGPGPGPGVMSVPASAGSQALFDLRAIAAQYPQYEGFYRIIALAEEQM
jgi:hypothetical protein